MILDSLSELWIWQFVARLHPLVIHFPIGALVIAFFLEMLTMGGKRTELRSGIRWLVYIGAGSASVAAGVGLMLAYGGNYSESTIFYHQWGGILTVILSLITAWLLYRASQSGEKKKLNMYRWMLSVAILVLTVTGHFGANLTHGDDYLTSVLPWNYESLSDGEFNELVQEVNQHRKMGTLSETHKTELNVGVRRIFAQTCYRCHDSNEAEGGLVLNSEEAVMKGGDSGPVIVPGKPEESELIHRLTLPAGHEDVMPQKGSSLSPDQVELIRLWIEVGAPWSDEEVKTFREAPMALRAPAPPDTESDFDNPVDKFTAAYFKEHGISWPEPVDDATFMRRVYLDVIGLVPDPVELRAFVRDPSPDKRDRLVDSLLSRRHDYTQHWLTFWNDLLRNDYTGTGFITGGREQITDWLYEALYQNMSYNRMVRELTNPGERSDGFIKGIKWRGAVNASQTTEMQAAQNISQSLLGVNLKCASCHDSFVSNLTLEEAYGFAQVFSEDPLAIQRCEVATGDTAEASFIYSEELGDIDESLSRDERLERLADILTQKQNGRLYRTIANRYWELFMGRSLVEPVDEMDNIPWNQELLDWLASDLIRHDYDLKRLISVIVRSKTYQLPSIGMSGEEAGSEEYVFRGPLRKRMTAEQFADAVSKVAAPFYYSVAYDPYEKPPAEGAWIWFNTMENDRVSQPDPGTYYFRHSFDLPAAREIEKAQLLVTADEAYKLYLNGTLVGQGADWRKIERIDVTEQLSQGTNLIAAAGRNGGSIPNPAGMLLNLRIKLKDGTALIVKSGKEGWKALDRQPKTGWQTADFDDSSWGEVRTFGSSRSSKHWGQLLKFTHDMGNQFNFARASLVENDDFLKEMGRPTRENVTTNRETEATLLQALELTNGDKLNEVMARGAERLVNEYGQATERMMTDLYLTAYGREPGDHEQEILNSRLAADKPGKEQIEDILWAIVMNPEFQLID
ncbi:DUF1549 domain-containing protein [Fodinibius sediminis]|uniref:Uncharacterized membrane protein n=1 Tax=Fodinibius sediminis TaxID=1214077 RepID=A0A521BQ06_9BACT|nr:DUF1549 domain-containing protein [Fodinibius sediminis]SMO48640.1 Uncharacterized membrane protein [Fodinibius sediminis]